MPRALLIALAAAPGLLWLGLPGLAALLSLPAVQATSGGHALQALLLCARPWVCLLAGLFFLLLAGLGRRPAWILLALLYLPGSGLRPLAQPPPEGLRVMASNVNAFSEGPAAAPFLGTQGLDVLLLVERREDEVPGLVRVADNFQVPMKRASHGSAWFCRQPERCAAAISSEYGSQSTRMPVALLRLSTPAPGGATVPACLLGLHAPPPAPLDPTGLQPYMARVASQIEGGRLAGQWGPCQAGDPVLVMGDFNTVPGSPAFELLRSTGLQDRLAGRGIWRASWPAGGGWPDLPFFAIDHLLVGPDLVVEGARRVRVPGTDHLAWVFSLRGR